MQYSIKKLQLIAFQRPNYHIYSMSGSKDMMKMINMVYSIV